jgi:hypothetical protein
MSVKIANDSNDVADDSKELSEDSNGNEHYLMNSLPHVER